MQGSRWRFPLVLAMLAAGVVIASSLASPRAAAAEIVFAGSSAGGSIYVMNDDGSNARLLTSGDYADPYVALDGTVLFTKEFNQLFASGDLYSYKDGKLATLASIPSGQPEEAEAGFGGRYVLHRVSDPGGPARELRVGTLPSGTTTAIPLCQTQPAIDPNDPLSEGGTFTHWEATVTDADEPTVNPTRDEIAFTGCQWRRATGNGTVAIESRPVLESWTPSGGERYLVRGEDNWSIDDPSFSPGGGSLVFIHWRGAASGGIYCPWCTYGLERERGEGIWVAGSDGSSPRQVLSLYNGDPGQDQAIQSPRFTGDGRIVFGFSDPKGTSGIYSIPAGCNACGMDQATLIHAGGAYPAWTDLHVVTPEPPTIKVPGTLTSEATSKSGAVVSYNVTAIDGTGAAVLPLCAPSSGSTFPIGKTTVSCTAHDSGGRTATTSFDVVVSHTRSPVLSVPHAIATTTADPAGVTVKYTASAVDAVDGRLTPSCRPLSGSKFKLGTTKVTCTARDSAGNASAATFAVTVVRLGTHLSKLGLAPGRFRAARSGPTVLTGGHTGTKVSYTLSAPATVTFRVKQATTGRRRGTSCVPDTRARRKLPRCTRYLPLRGSFKHTGRRGLNSFRFTGRLSNKTLKPGNYQLIATLPGTPEATTSFTIRR